MSIDVIIWMFEWLLWMWWQSCCSVRIATYVRHMLTECTHITNWFERTWSHIWLLFTLISQLLYVSMCSAYNWHVFTLEYWLITKHSENLRLLCMFNICVSDAICYSLSLFVTVTLRIIYDQHMLCIWFLEQKTYHKHHQKSQSVDLHLCSAYALYMFSSTHMLKFSLYYCFEQNLSCY